MLSLFVLAALLLAQPATVVVAWGPFVGENKEPIMLDRSGGFTIGGYTLYNPNRPDQTLSCDHAYVEYFIPWTPRRTSLVLWHSSSTQVWQNRWDGGEGYKDMFLRRSYPIYLFDGPRIGRANWGCVEYTYRPSVGRDQSNFGGWNFGPSYGRWWPGIQFPTEDKVAWLQATSARYLEFDTLNNVEIAAEAGASAADSGGLGDSIVFLTNSAAGLRAQLTAIKSNSTNIKGIVAYESMGFVLPDREDINVTTGRSGFGPIVVPVEDFKKLAKLTAVQFVWGDNRNETHQYLRMSRRVAALINEYGGNAEVLVLGRDAGLYGSTHIPFADLDNDKVAGLLDDLLERNGLDGYVDEATDETRDEGTDEDAGEDAGPEGGTGAGELEEEDEE